jgi:hypothetical protein
MARPVPSRASAAARAFAVLLAISTVFPIVAALLPATSVPAIVGLVDVALAAITIMAGFAVDAYGRPIATDADRARGWRVVSLVATVLPALLVVFFLVPGMFRWEVLLVGLAWRSWLLVWVIPSCLALLRPGPEPGAAA